MHGVFVLTRKNVTNRMSHKGLLQSNRFKALYIWGAPHGILGGPWPTQKFLWVGHNAFGPPKSVGAN
jgi:hypothetical protein